MDTMAIYTLLRRWETGILALVEAESSGMAIERIAKARVSLAYADLKGLDAPCTNLQGVDLRGADLEAASLPSAILRRADLRTASLVSADLRGTTLRQADLRRADVRHADLRQADLRDADLTGANLHNACVTGARLDGARIDWRWTACVLELLRRDAGDRDDANRLVADLAFASDERPYAWLETVIRRPALIGWVASVIGRAVQPGDDAPEVLHHLSMGPSEFEPLPTGEVSNEHSIGFYWTRAVHPRMTSRRSPS